MRRARCGGEKREQGSCTPEEEESTEEPPLQKKGPMWDRAFRYFVECENGYLAAAMDLAS